MPTETTLKSSSLTKPPKDGSGSSRKSRSKPQDDKPEYVVDNTKIIKYQEKQQKVIEGLQGQIDAQKKVIFYVACLLCVIFIILY